MSILFLGDAPSKRNVDPKRAFIGASCWPRLLGWMTYMKLDPNEVLLYNSDNERGLAIAKEVKDKGGKIVAIGNNASNRLSALRIGHFKLPHPSGLNRQINNKEYIDKMLKECYNYLRG